MADLEEMDSSRARTPRRRVPTPKGLPLLRGHAPHLQPMQELERQHSPMQLGPDDPHRVVAAPPRCSSDLTHFAGLVGTPAPRRGAAPRGVLRLTERRVLLIIGPPWRGAEPRARDRPSVLGLAAAGVANYVTSYYSGLTSTSCAPRCAASSSICTRHLGLMQAAIAIGSEAVRQPLDGVVISGGRNLLGRGNAQLHDALRRLFDMFETKRSCWIAARASERAEGVKIFIGGESRACRWTSGDRAAPTRSTASVARSA